MRALRISLSVLCVSALGLAASASAAGPAREPFFPGAGNRGYDARVYDLDLRYRPAAAAIDAKVNITARASEALPSFSLDFSGPRVSAVRVGDEPAGFRRSHGKLIVEPREKLAPGQVFTATIDYSGVPPEITDPDGTQEGWYPTDDGVLAVGEPEGTAAWIPCDNVPADKARFQFAVTVPRGLKAMDNGRLHRVERKDGNVTFHWAEGNPMSTYLAVLDIGRGRIVKTRPDGIPAWTLIDPRLATGSRPLLAELPRIIRFESRLYGGYPFEAAGSIVDYAPKLGYALETQDRPIYPYLPDLTTLVHETAHQWFGDAVGLRRWPDIWLNEGFATWTEWFYAERHGGRSAQAIFNRLHRVPASNTKLWNPPSGHPGTPAHLFGPSVYVRGAMALEALRLKIGTRPMLRVLREWAVEHRYGSADTGEFIALAERVSGKNLGPFFERWLYRRGKP